ncbi:hypothetical protein B0H14DRAFT_2823578 [Mycena olivaceomarginata]|nr:hypothetical protein B0H14DRAFT_2823578 [Mycena olivaceomarginata]
MEALMSWISFSYFLLFQNCLYCNFFPSDVSLLVFGSRFSFNMSKRCFKSSLHPTVSASVNGLSLLIRSGRSSMFAFIVKTISASATTPVIAPSSPGTGLPAAAA